MEYVYIDVAGWRISVALKEGGLPSNYTPFLTDAGLTELTLSMKDRLPAVDIEPLYTNSPDVNMLLLRMYKAGEDYYFEMAPGRSLPFCGRLLLSEGLTKAELAISDPDRKWFSVNNALMLQFALASAGMGTLLMHASVVVHEGKGYMFLGPSGTGKSTHSSLWLKCFPGTTLLNDDNPAIRVLPDGRVMVYGTPWSGKTPCYKNECVPLGGIVRLSQKSENNISRLSLAASYSSVMASASGFRPIEKLASGQHDTISRIVTAVPCYELGCRPDEAAARLCKETVHG